VPAAQAFFANLSVSLFHKRADAAALLDGVMVDGTSYRGPTPYPNVSAARYQRLFLGKMAMLAMLHNNLQLLNPAAEVLGNPLLEYGDPEQAAGARWNTTLPYYDGAFDEMFGSFATMQGYLSPSSTGEWDVERMRCSFDSIINASAAGKTVVVHAFPGPAGSNAFPGGMFPERGDPTEGNTFHVAQWAGPVRVPETAEGCREAADARLVESLAPFLIVASERVFFGYGWSYNLEDGYIPCPPEVSATQATALLLLLRNCLDILCMWKYDTHEKR